MHWKLLHKSTFRAIIISLARENLIYYAPSNSQNVPRNSSFRISEYILILVIFPKQYIMNDLLYHSILYFTKNINLDNKRSKIISIIFQN